MTEISILKNWLQAPGNSNELLGDVLNELSWLDVWSKKMATKLKELLDAKTFNNTWIEMNDNKTQLEALKLLLKMHWVKVDQSVNINLFNIPSKNDRLEY